MQNLSIKPNESSWDQQSPYWGWENLDGKLSMIFSHYKLLEVCFPYGIQAAIEHGKGRPVMIEITEGHVEK